jgi:signal transduction histidine kinase
VAVNVAVLGLAFALAAVAFREVRRAERLRALSEHQARVAELERQVLHNERLASLGRLAAGLAHEINNPLAGMSNYLALLQEDLAAGETREVGQLASRVREGLDRIAGITRQVLAFAAPGRPPKGPVDLGDLLQRNLDFLRADPTFRDIELKLALPRPPLTVEGNATTLNQLVLNLLVNAAQAQPGGGEIEVSLASNGSRALLTVADRGPGLDPETLEHAFEPFFSTRGSTGLGLAVCRGIADDHEGTLRAGNRPGGGARFEVELPLPSGDAR